MRNITHKLYFFLIAFVLLIQNAQAKDTLEDERLWLNVNVQSELPIKGLNWYLDVQPRWREQGKEFDQFVTHPAIFYKFSPKSSVWFGYAGVVSHPAGKENVHENRLWQQFLYKFDPIDDWKLQSRTRLEQRAVESKNDIGYRFRQMLKIEKPITAIEPLSFIISDELFINMNDTDWGASRGIDQNRAFIGFGYKVNKNANVELGYLNQAVYTPTTNKENHILSMNLALSF